ncbi:MAG: class I SAM-dependent methyltransferase [Rhodocyclaceae bacterium]|nr:class I SAM-dependent methyltransferase [Rhodocyclaceae bacterium]
MPPDNAKPATTYDVVPYESFPFPDTHPDRLATLGRLFGLRPPSLDNCRVLELGCASGGNLISMALAMPEAEFVGVDLSSVQVAQGQQAITELELSNIRLLSTSITDIDESLGQFDYILTHGVYSWVPNEVQEKILSICAKQLSANGIAYISYNTLPGWRMRGLIRDAMRFHAMQFEDPALRVAQARGILDFLAKWVPAENNAYGMLLKSELDTLHNAADYYILHEHLEDINEPIYFHEFVERAGRHGLQYLAEADISTMLASNLPKGVFDTLVRIAPDVIRQEQFMDFLRNRTFRQTLLVRDEHSIVRTLTPQCVSALWASATLTSVGGNPDLASPQEALFQGPKGGMVATSNAVTKAAIQILTQHWPGRLSFSALLDGANELVARSGEHISPKPVLSPESILASDLLQCHMSGMVELHSGPAPFVTQPGEHPVASALARWQAGRGLRQVTTLRHEMVLLEDGPAKLLALLDGTRSRNELYIATEELGLHRVALQGSQKIYLPIREWVDHVLSQMARSALMLA